MGCICRSIGELVQRNADYLVNAISLRLRHFCENKKSPLVLKVMLQYSSSDILPLIGDTIQEVSFYTAHNCPNMLSFLGGDFYFHRPFEISAIIWMGLIFGLTPSLKGRLQSK